MNRLRLRVTANQLASTTAHETRLLTTPQISSPDSTVKTASKGVAEQVVPDPAEHTC
ncbi:MAG: hypothetical protein HND48_12150 [Chloroflexi bacterium]|nr:hypothetical protein [Chloroflexota bacterium]